MENLCNLSGVSGEENMINLTTRMDSIEREILDVNEV